MKKKSCLLVAMILVAVSSFAQNALDIDTAISFIAGKIIQQLPSDSVIGSGGFMSDTETLSRYINDNLESALRKNGTFTIVERGANLSRINKELDWQYSSGAVSDRAAVDLGKQLGAQYIIYGYFEQLGNYMSLNVRVSNVETGESPVIENQTVASSSKLNELLGDSRNLSTANDYLAMIARCKDKRVRLERERNNEISSTTSQIKSKYQPEINAINTRVQKKNQSDEVFNRKKTEDLNRVTQQRDSEIKGETDKIKIKYDEQNKSIENSEKELRQRLSQTSFYLNGTQVDVRMGEFQANAKPQNWPVTIKSLDALVKFKHETRYEMVSSEEDNEEEFDLIENAKASGKLSGEIKFQVVPSEVEDDFSVKVQNVRVFLKDTKQTLVNESIDKIVGTTSVSIKSEVNSSKTATVPSTSNKKSYSEPQKTESFSDDVEKVWIPEEDVTSTGHLAAEYTFLTLSILSTSVGFPLLITGACLDYSDLTITGGIMFGAGLFSLLVVYLPLALTHDYTGGYYMEINKVSHLKISPSGIGLTVNL